MLVRQGVRIDEDRLTHAVLGLMRYLPAELWFVPFIEEIRTRNPEALAIFDPANNPTIQMWPTYPVPSRWKHAFWRPKSQKVDLEVPKGNICPDAVISTDKWIMFVESEYSHYLEAEQLFQQFALASQESDGNKFFVLLINTALTRPAHCMGDSCNLNKPEAGVEPDDSLEKFISACCSCSLGLPFTESDVKERLLWINWQTLYSLFAHLPLEHNPRFRGLPDSFKCMVRVMRDDVCELLERVDLVPIDFDALDWLAGQSLTAASVPYLQTVESIIEFLNELDIPFEAIPRWQGQPRISGTLSRFNIRPAYIPEPLTIKPS